MSYEEKYNHLVKVINKLVTVNESAGKPKFEGSELMRKGAEVTLGVIMECIYDLEEK